MNYQRRKRYILRVRIFFVAIFLLAVAAAAYGYTVIRKTEQSSQNGGGAVQTTASYYAESVNILRSPYFQFQANKTWVEVPGESTPTKFIYRSFRGNLIEHQMTIYVNESPANLVANRVLPVTISDNSELLPATVTDHCIKATGKSSIDDPMIAMERVKFKCDADSTNYAVLVGQVGGTTTLPLKRADGSMANYTIYYTNLKATPEPSQITDIVNSFQAR